jgi:predicted nucleotide-binding protein
VPITRVFVGSSAAARSQARALVRRFDGGTLEFLPWWDAFTAGATLLENLDRIARGVDAALLVFSPDVEAVIRGNGVWLPNQNVLFEFGYFCGRFGRNRVAMVKYGDFYLPSDLGGYVHIFGDASFKRGGALAVSKRTEREFNRWVRQV